MDASQIRCSKLINSQALFFVNKDTHTEQHVAAQSFGIRELTPHCIAKTLSEEPTVCVYRVTVAVVLLSRVSSHGSEALCASVGSDRVIVVVVTTVPYESLLRESFDSIHKSREPEPGD